MTEMFGEDHKRAVSRWPVWPLFLGALLLTLLWLGVKTVRIYRAYNSLQTVQSDIEAMAGAGLSTLDVNDAEAVLLQMRKDVLTLKSETDLFLPFTGYLGWLPKIGGSAAAAPPLLDMADSATAAAVLAFRGLKPALAVMQDSAIEGQNKISHMLQVIQAGQEDFTQAERLLEDAIRARERLGDSAELPTGLRSLIEQLDPWLEVSPAAIRLVRVLPDVAGNDSLKRYLIVAQNEDELRPTGGFISGAGLLVLEQGHILEMNLGDGYKVDNWREKPYEFPPEPLYSLMGLELFLFRDANYWPDFPTSAEAMMELYSYGQETPPLDGVIAIDQKLVQILLQATGPIALGEDGGTLDSDHIIERFREEWSFHGDPESAEWIQWFTGRKAFIGEFASALQDKLESDFNSIDPLRLLQSVRDAAAAKHIQFYMRDPQAEEAFRRLGWDGRMETAPGDDFIAVVDTNVGYSKANLFVNREFSYSVDLGSSEAVESELVVTYQHARPPRNEPCVQDLSYSFSLVNDYVNIANRCYWNFLRVYVPAGSRMKSATTHLVPAESLISGRGDWSTTAGGFVEIPGLETFDNFLLLPWGETVPSIYRYELSPAVEHRAREQHEYLLSLFKQPGTRPEPFQINVMLPEGAVLTTASPEPTSIEGGLVRFDLVLNGDVTLFLTFDFVDQATVE